MGPMGRHDDAGAYALGVLDAADAFRFEDHLAQCALCAARVDAFAPTARSLAWYASRLPPSVGPAAEPGPGMLRRLLAEVAVARRRRRRWLGALAAAVLLAVAAPAGSVVAGAGAEQVRLSGRNPSTGLSATLTARDRAWGTQVGLTVRGTAGSRGSCALVAVGRDGSERTVTMWTAAAGGAAGVATVGSVALHPEGIARFEVRDADGRRLVTLLRP